MLTNEQLAQQDNAGVAVRIFARSDEILWYVPFFTDQVATEEEESDIPAAVGPLIVLTDQEHYTLPVALATLSREHIMDVEMMMAGAVAKKTSIWPPTRSATASDVPR